jgi:hypothetical protein
VSYPSTADWNSLYHTLLNASLCLIQVSIPTVYSFSSLHILNMFLFWILPYQDLHMIAWPRLIITILFCCRISYSILAHFYFGPFILIAVYSFLAFSTYLEASYFFYVPLWHMYAGILPFYSSVIIYLHMILPYCGSVTIYLLRYSSILSYRITRSRVPLNVHSRDKDYLKGDRRTVVLARNIQ